ncbi:monocarboxylate transporter 12-like [Mercenaria mercenaria]|uniref:monocarboxylate transporter 12-like n=1 Tax=Mercenaria mercenaria TaxID=6596 RepID=UPI00234EEDC2|nr:monocarboxylate transporter 12-like [Mercenaria mercenaria]
MPLTKFGPLAGLLISKWSYRKVAFIGAICSSAGLVAMSFAPSVAYAYFFYGLLNGFGNSLVVTSSQVSCGQRYIKHRGLTSSFVLSGTGLGSGVFPIMINNLIQTYGWRGSLLLLSGINMQSVIFALLLFPTRRLPSANPKDRRLNGEMKSTETQEHTRRKCNLDKGDFDERQKQVFCTNTFNSYINIYMRKLQIHLKKIKNADFVIFLISTCLFNFGYNAFLIFLPQHSTVVGFDENDSSLALTLAGAGLFVGCIVGSVLGNFNCKIVMLIIGSLGFGCVVILMDLFQQREKYMSLSFMVGMSSGFETAYLLAITCEILGDEVMAIGFGCVMFSVGVGCMIGPPVAGILVDHYHDTSYVLYLSAAVTILSGLLMLPYPIKSIARKCCTNTTEFSGRPASSTITLVSVISDKKFEMVHMNTLSSEATTNEVIK